MWHFPKIVVTFLIFIKILYCRIPIDSMKTFLVWHGELQKFKTALGIWHLNGHKDRILWKTVHIQHLSFMLMAFQQRFRRCCSRVLISYYTNTRKPLFGLKTRTMTCCVTIRYSTVKENTRLHKKVIKSVLLQVFAVSSMRCENLSLHFPSNKPFHKFIHTILRNAIPWTNSLPDVILLLCNMVWMN